MSEVPQKAPEIVLNDLVARTPGEEGKWFAAAEEAGLYDFALKLARRSPVDHRTLIAQRMIRREGSGFALNCGLMALYWICTGRAYEATSGEVLTAYAQIRRCGGHCAMHRGSDGAAAKYA